MPSYYAAKYHMCMSIFKACDSSQNYFNARAGTGFGLMLNVWGTLRRVQERTLKASSQRCVTAYDVCECVCSAYMSDYNNTGVKGGRLGLMMKRQTHGNGRKCTRVLQLAHGMLGQS